ncbi:hypothetical protein BJ878DRAFT_307347 [Calycina marina]|uniref:Uncharacterized protein n=1 Tax=Calycina marina TaxID=1763456 RepID=A0A9P8CGX3_9HELO|nr:hypothetical protein BJ878DRAFT_307347 [Calycina marina]
MFFVTFIFCGLFLLVSTDKSYPIISTGTVVIREIPVDDGVPAPAPADHIPCPLVVSLTRVGAMDGCAKATSPATISPMPPFVVEDAEDLVARHYELPYITKPFTFLPDTLTLAHPITEDGTCGLNNKNATCIGGSQLGQCCGLTGQCHWTHKACRDECQKDYGVCWVNDPVEDHFPTLYKTSELDSSTMLSVKPISKDGYCGPKHGDTSCINSGFGQCCNSGGTCTSDAHSCRTHYGCDPHSGYSLCHAAIIEKAIAYPTTETFIDTHPTQPSSTPAIELVSQDGYCGRTGSNQTCLGSDFGDCCTCHGECTSSDEKMCTYLTGCQEEFGACLSDLKDSSLNPPPINFKPLIYSLSVSMDPIPTVNPRPTTSGSHLTAQNIWSKVVPYLGPQGSWNIYTVVLLIVLIQLFFS